MLHVTVSVMCLCHPVLQSSATSEGGSEAEGIKTFKVLMAWAVAADARGQVRTSAGLSWCGHRVLCCAVGQPPCIAPVQPLFPGSKELVKCGQCCTLLLTHLLGLVEVQLVAPTGGVKGKHHP